jgi:hypothetical protein
MGILSTGGRCGVKEALWHMRFTTADLRFLAGTLFPHDPAAAARHLSHWQTDAAGAAAWLDDARLLQRLHADDGAVIELSPRFLFTVLLRRIRRDLASVPYTIERVERDGRIVVFDASVVLDMLRSEEIFDYLVELLVSFERAETFTVARAGARAGLRRLSTASISDMLEFAGLVDASMRPMVFRRIGDIALFTTGLFPESIQRDRRLPAAAPALLGSPRRPWRLEDYEEEGRTFYRLASDSLQHTRPTLARVLARLAEDFTLARKPLHVLAERYVAWARPHWRQVIS